MALINCLECNKEISDKAESCPKCGNPMRDTTTNQSQKGRGCIHLIVIIFVLIFILFSIGYCSSNLGTKTTPSAARSVLKNGTASLNTPNLINGNAIEWQEADVNTRFQTAKGIVMRSKTGDILSNRTNNATKTMGGVNDHASELRSALDAAFEKEPDQAKNKMMYTNQEVLATAVILMTGMGWLK